MNREILFRGKRTDNGEWVFGFLFDDGMVDSKKKFIGYVVIEKSKIGAEYIYDVTGIDFFEVIPETVCQYTGLTDKNERKIFDGDIVRDIFNSSVVGIVRYGEYRNTFNDDEHGGHVGFYVEWQNKKDLLRKDLVYWAKNSEFIGNIFDNPDLLEGGAA